MLSGTKLLHLGVVLSSELLHWNQDNNIIMFSWLRLVAMMVMWTLWGHSIFGMQNHASMSMITRKLVPSLCIGVRPRKLKHKSMQEFLLAYKSSSTCKSSIRKTAVPHTWLTIIKPVSFVAWDRRTTDAQTGLCMWRHPISFLPDILSWRLLKILLCINYHQLFLCVSEYLTGRD